MIKEVQAAVSIPVMAKARIGHFVEAQVLQELGVDFIDESEVLTPADEITTSTSMPSPRHSSVAQKILARHFGASRKAQRSIRTKGEPGTGDVIHAVRHMRQIVKEMKALTVLDEQELYAAARSSARHMNSSAWLRRRASCRCRTSPRAASPPRQTLRSSASSARETVFVGSGIFMSDSTTKLNVSSYREGDRYEAGDWKRRQSCPA